MRNTRSITLQATLVAAAVLLSLVHSPMVSAQRSEETPINHHITVSQNDVHAAGNVKSSYYHVQAAHTPEARALAKTLNAAGAYQPETNGVASPNAVPHAALTAPFFFPADLKKGTGPTLTSTTSHALYVDFTGSVAANWGNPEGFLRDLNLSTFIHLTDQYTGQTSNGRYPVGGNAAVTYGVYGNVLYQHEIWAIVHAGGVKYGTGAGHIYHVFLPQGMDTCFDLQGGCYSPDNTSTWAFCAYHSAVTFSDIGTVVYSVEPYQNVPGCAVATPSPNGQLADSTNSVLSHEFFEAITDPVAGSGFINRVSLDLGGYEIGDECQVLGNSSGDAPVPTFKINGKNYEVQTEYSNTYHACAAQP